MQYFKGNKGKRFLDYFIFAVLLIVAYKLIDLLPWSAEKIGVAIGVIAPLIAGFIIAFILCIPAGKLEDLFHKLKPKNFFYKHARGISVLITYFLFLVIIALLLYAVLPTFVSNLTKVVGNLPNYTDTISRYVKNIADDNGKVFGMEMSEITHKISNGILSFFDTERVTNILGGAFAVGSAIISVVISVIVSVYMLLARDDLIHVCGKMFSIFLRPEQVHATRLYLRRVSDIFYNYIYSQLLDSLVVAIILGITFSIIGIKNAIFFALLMGICNLIPYFGAIVGGVVVSLATLITGNLTMAIITAVCIVIIMQIDGNILQPKIVGSTVGIRPLYVLIAITIGGGYFGFLGILLCVPFVATVRMLLLDLIAYIDKRRKEHSLTESVEE